VLPVQKTHFKRRPHDAVAHLRREVAQIQPLRRRIGRTEQARKPLPQIRSTQQNRLRANELLAGLDGKDRRTRRQSGEKVAVVRSVEFSGGIKFLHGRGGGS
jgi:hypothetical protein